MRRIFDFFCVRRNFEEDNDTTTTRRRASFADALRSRFGRASARVDPRGAKEKSTASRFPLFF